MDFAAEFALKIIVERGDRRPRDRSFRARKRRCPRVDSRRNRSAPRVLRLHREISGRRHSASDSRAAHQKTGGQISGLRRPRISARSTARAWRGAISSSRIARAKSSSTSSTRSPGFTSISMYPKLWEASGLPYSKLIDRLIELAFALHREKARTKYSIELPAGAGGALEA